MSLIFSVAIRVSFYLVSPFLAFSHSGLYKFLNGVIGRFFLVWAGAVVILVIVVVVFVVCIA